MLKNNLFCTFYIHWICFISVGSALGSLVSTELYRKCLGWVSIRSFVEIRVSMLFCVDHCSLSFRSFSVIFILFWLLIRFLPPLLLFLLHHLFFSFPLLFFLSFLQYHPMPFLPLFCFCTHLALWGSWSECFIIFWICWNMESETKYPSASESLRFFWRVGEMSTNQVIHGAFLLYFLVYMFVTQSLISCLS